MVSVTLVLYTFYVSLLMSCSNFKINACLVCTDLIRVALPKVLPPSFRGTVARYLYYLVVILRGRRVNFKNDHSLSQFTPLHLVCKYFFLPQAFGYVDLHILPIWFTLLILIFPCT
jgi:hypothetical protein